MKRPRQLTAVTLMLAALSPLAQAQQANPRYVIKGDQVYDKKTNLTWARCSVGQRWKEGVGCMGVVKQFTWNDAKHQGGNGWRLPNKDELATLIDQKRTMPIQMPTIDEVAFPDMDHDNLCYWSSTPENTFLAWNVGFIVGDVWPSSYGTPCSVRLVRDGKIFTFSRD